MKYYVLLLLTIIFFVSCNNEKKIPQQIPSQGKIEYDVCFSQSVKENELVGNILPNKFNGCYNQNGIKMKAKCGFGMLDFNTVFSTTDSYSTINFQDLKILIPLEVLVIQDSIDAHRDAFKINYDEEIVKIMGFDSKRATLNAESPNGEQLIVEIFYAPIPGVNNKIAGIDEFNVPGLITAMNVTFEDLIMNVTLSNLEECTINDESFNRPADFKVVDLKELQEMQKNIVIQQ